MYRVAMYYGTALEAVVHRLPRLAKQMQNFRGNTVVVGQRGGCEGTRQVLGSNALQAAAESGTKS